MANVPETPDYPAGIYQLETSDPVLGGAGGISNRQAEQLANRTAWLKAKVDAFLDGTVAVFKATKLATARTLSISGAGSGSGSFDGSGNTNIVLTLADSGVAAGTYLKVTVNAKGIVTAASVLTSADLPANLALTGAPTAPTAPAGTNTTQLANTAFVQAAVAALVASSPAALDTLNELAAALGDDPNFATTMTNALAAKAPLASPPLSGVPTAPTAAANTNTNQLATTAFVVAQVLASLRGLPCFHAYPAASQPLSAGVNTRINFGTRLFDLSNNFNSVNSSFVAPVAGYYEFDAAVHFTGNGSWQDNGGVELWVNGVVSRRIAESYGPRNQLSGSSGPLYLAAGDAVQVYAWTDVAATINQFPAQTYFNGRRIS